jgi:hypothetical protein
MLLAMDGEEIRAGLLLHHSSLWLQGTERPFCWLGLPLSEGLVDPRHGMAIVQLVSAVLAREPLLMSLGIGSLDETFSKFLIQLGWRHATVPFVFHPVRPREVLGRMPYLRARPGVNLAAHVLRSTGLARLLEGGLHVVRRSRQAARAGYAVVREPSFDTWADDVYARARSEYAAAVVRDAAALNVCYPPNDTRYVRLRLTGDGGRTLGWIVVIHARMRDNRYFGDLHVGTLVDGLGPLGAVPTLVGAGLQWLVDAGVDLVVANWSHGSWLAGCRRWGFLPGPSNFFFFVSPGGNRLLETVHLPDIHLTRGDGDGPFNLMPPEDRPA